LVAVTALVVAAVFESRGFRWGGHWTRLQDYQHFERPLR
jgi:hypothetical protein